MVCLRYLWAFPATILGLFFVPIAWLSGGKVAVTQGAIEVCGGLVGGILRRGLPCVGSAAAMTLGHVILGRNQDCLNRSRRHEHVHVRQYERWGPFMLPVYLLMSAVLYFRGLDPYLDNPFECEAFAKSQEPPESDSAT
jgi:hypothetical protein